MQSMPYNKDVSLVLEKHSLSTDKRAFLGRCFGYLDKTTATGTYYLMLCNTCQIPITGEVDLIIHSQPLEHTTNSHTTFDYSFEDNKIVADKGIYWCISTSASLRVLVSTDMAKVTLLFRPA